MKAEIVRDDKHKDLISGSLFVQVTNMRVPDDFIVVRKRMDGMKVAIKPVQDYEEGKKLVKILREVY